MFEEDKQPDEENIKDLSESLDSSIADDDSQTKDNTVEESVTEPVPEKLIFEETSLDEPVVNRSNDDNNESSQNDDPVMVQPVQFTSFDEEENLHGKENRNLDLLMNVNLQMSVELGRTELPFKKVLELTRGSIISLDKLAGEPVELYANGKLVAFGEVVVIEDNFGLRITSIAAPEERLKTVHDGKDKEHDAD